MHHENILHFVGAIVEQDKALVLVWLNTARRSLENVLFDEAIQLNAMFKASIMRDLVKVMQAIYWLCVIPKSASLLYMGDTPGYGQN